LILDQAVVQKYYTHKKAYNSVEISEIYSHHLFEIPNFQRKKVRRFFFLEGILNKLNEFNYFRLLISPVLIGLRKVLLKNEWTLVSLHFIEEHPNS